MVRILVLTGMLSFLVACQSTAPRAATAGQPAAEAGPGSPAESGQPAQPRASGNVARGRPGSEKNAAQSTPDDRDSASAGRMESSTAANPVGPEPDIWQRMRSDFQFVQCEPASTMRASLRAFTAHPTAFARLFKNAAPHIEFVAGRLEQAGLPAEFAMLPMVESRYLHRPRQAGSRGPAGPWQLMPHTARAMGLTVDRSRDQRMDLEASTDAAIRLLKSLYAQFGDWTLVNLAYNAGDGRVRGALRRAGGWHGDPYALSLSPITRAHFSRLRALVCICMTPERYGLELPARPGRPPGARFVVAASGSAPVAAADGALDTHVVARGDSLWDLARRYGIKLENLRRWNALGARSLLHPGQVLRLRAP